MARLSALLPFLLLFIGLGVIVALLRDGAASAQTAATATPYPPTATPYPPGFEEDATAQSQAPSGGVAAATAVSPTRTATVAPTIAATGTIASTITLTPTLIPQRTAVASFTPIPTDTPAPSATSATNDALICVPGETYVVLGQGPPFSQLLLTFGERVVGGGVVDQGGQFRIPMDIGPERPGTYDIAVRDRATGREIERGVCSVPTATSTLTPTSILTPTPR